MEAKIEDHDLLVTAARTLRENEARTPQEWCDKASEAVRDLRGALRDAIKLGNADVPKDGPMSPVSALLTASFVHVGALVHSLEWLERSLQAQPTVSPQDRAAQETQPKE